MEDYGSIRSSAEDAVVVKETAKTNYSIIRRPTSCGLTFALVVFFALFAVLTNTFYGNVGAPLELYTFSSTTSGSTTDESHSSVMTSTSTATATVTATTADPSKQSIGADPPHIIFILADDLGWNSIAGFDEASDIAFAAPELASLSQQGLRMTNYYAQDLCTPSRAAFLTGRYPLSMGMQYGTVLAAKPWGLPLDETTIAQVLRGAGGYSTHAIGKWHVGHHSSNYLPTARGFDTFVGYLDGENHYFSKRDPQNSGYRDFMIADQSCYYAYNRSDVKEYSTHLYRDMAINRIKSYKDEDGPMFMYLAFQAVHSPFEDVEGNQIIPKEYLDEAIYSRISTDVKGYKRQLYAMALASLDDAVKDIVTALEEQGMVDKTYLIFASDNGGCYMGGGKNAPLRGTKATVFEGGSKVDAFIYSRLLPETLRGKTFDKLMHVTDWFPTILELAGITVTAADASSSAVQVSTYGSAKSDNPTFTYTPPSTGTDGKVLALDGVSQVNSWSSGVPARTDMLYNSFANIASKNRNMWVNGTFAIRNERYKLMHFYNSTRYATWYTTDSTGVLADDDTLDSKQCQYTSLQKWATFDYALFDLQEDPYERNNLYFIGSPEIEAIKTELYDKIKAFNDRATPDRSEEVALDTSTSAVSWKAAGRYIMPFTQTKVSIDGGSSSAASDATASAGSALSFCGVWSDE